MKAAVPLFYMVDGNQPALNAEIELRLARLAILISRKEKRLAVLKETMNVLEGPSLAKGMILLEIVVQSGPQVAPLPEVFEESLRAVPAKSQLELLVGLSHVFAFTFDSAGALRHVDRIDWKMFVARSSSDEFVLNLLEMLAGLWTDGIARADSRVEFDDAWSKVPLAMVDFVNERCWRKKGQWKEDVIIEVDDDFDRREIHPDLFEEIMRNPFAFEAAF